jgi:purine-binding chemotaxis protein CheW
MTRQSGRTNGTGQDTRAEPRRSGSDRSASQVVVFGLQDRQYAFAIATVTEILRMVAITEVPESPEWLTGVINLRGRTVPVIDLRTRLGLSRRAPRRDTAILVVECAARPVGFIADEVVEIVALPTASVDSVDELAGETHPVSAVARQEERLIVILDPDRLADGALDLDLPEGIV